MTEEELQQIIESVWSQRTMDEGRTGLGSQYETLDELTAAIRSSEWYRALSAADRPTATALVTAAMETGAANAPRQASISFERAAEAVQELEGETSVLQESFFEEDLEEVQPELTQQEIERRGSEISERVEAGEVDPEDLSEEDQDSLEAWIESIAAQGEMGRQTMQLYGLTTGMIPDWLESLQEEARVAGLGDFNTRDLIDELEFGNNAALMGLADQLSVGNTYDRVFVKTAGGGEFFVPGDEYREVLAVVGESNADLVNIGIAAAAEQGIAYDDGWKNFMIVALENQERVSQGGLAAIGQSDLPLSAITASVDGPTRRTLQQSRLAAEARQYSQFLRRYNGVHALAMLAAGGRQDLAEEAYQSGGLSAQGRQEARDFLAGLGSDRDLQAMNIDPSDKYWTQLTQGPEGGFGAEAGLSLLPNSEDSREAYRTLYRSFFMEDPDDAVLDGFAENVKSQYMEFDAASRQGTNLFRDEPARERELREALRSPEAMAMSQIRENPQYDALYGNRGSLTEAQYRTQFQNRVAGFGGDIGASTGAIQAGMRTGRGATTTGRLLFSEEGKQAQGLQGRLAQAANVIARNT